VTLPKGERADSLLTSPYIRFTNSISRTAVLRVADVLLQHLVSSAFAFIVCSWGPFNNYSWAVCLRPFLTTWLSRHCVGNCHVVVRFCTLRPYYI